MIPPHDRDRLRVFMELDRMLARDANEYEATRSAYLAAHQEWLAARVEAGVEAPKDAEREMSSERDDFPPAEEARARDR